MKELIEEHRGILMHLARRYFVAADGVFGFDELFHEATVALWRAWESYHALEEKPARFTTWLYYEVRNDLVRYCCEMGATIRVPRQSTAAARAKRLIPTVSLDVPVMEGGADRHELLAPEKEAGCFYHDDEIALVMRLVDSLPPADAWLLKQRHMESRPLKDIAAELGMTGEGVRMRELRILSRLRRRMRTEKWKLTREALEA